MISTENPNEIPSVQLDVYKEGQLIETINLENKDIFKFGKQDSSGSGDTVQLLHESISDVHAAIAFDQEKGLVLIDLASEHGTCLNGSVIQPNVPTEVRKRGDLIKFGASTRSYKVSVDYSRMLKAQEEELKKLQKEMNQLENLKEDDEIDANTFKNTIGVIREDTIHVNNLPYAYRQDDLRHIFKDCGELLNIHMPNDRGFAFVTFDSEKAARKALNLDGHKVMNRPLKISIARNQGPKEPRQRKEDDVGARRKRHDKRDKRDKKRRYRGSS